MAFTYDPTTPDGMVRLTINDVDATNPVFTDAEITAFLTMGRQDWRLAAAYALDTIATDQALTLKVIKTLDLETSGDKVAAALHGQAQALRTEVDLDPTDYFVIEFADPPFQYREHWTKQALRELS